MKETVGYEENVMLNSGQEALKTFAFSVSYFMGYYVLNVFLGSNYVVNRRIIAIIESKVKEQRGAEYGA